MTKYSILSGILCLSTSSCLTTNYLGPKYPGKIEENIYRDIWSSAVTFQVAKGDKAIKALGPSTSAAQSITSGKQKLVTETTLQNYTPEEIINLRMRSIDEAYYKYKKWLRGGYNSVNNTDFAIRQLNEIFSTLGDSVFAPKELQIFGAISAASGATNDHFKKNYLYEKTFDKVIQIMDIARNEQRAKIEKHKGSYAEKLRMVDVYFELGTLSSAYVTLGNLIEKKDIEKAAKDAVKDQNTSKPKP